MFLRVAGFASRAECAPMFVVFLVTSLARGRSRPLRRRRGVTAFTFGRLVFSNQRVLRVFVVIERGRFPPLFHVAGLALLAKDSLMSIVFPVTGSAVGLEFLFVEMPRMAALACYGDMLVE